LLSPAAFVAVNVTTLAANEQHITVVSRVGLVELGEHLTFFFWCECSWCAVELM